MDNPKVFILSTYQKQSDHIDDYSHIVKPERVVLRLNYVPKGSIVFMYSTSINFFKKDHKDEFDIRPLHEINKYHRSITSK